MRGQMIAENTRHTLAKRLPQLHIVTDRCTYLTHAKMHDPTQHLQAAKHTPWDESIMHSTSLSAVDSIASCIYATTIQSRDVSTQVKKPALIGKPSNYFTTFSVRLPSSQPFFHTNARHNRSTSAKTIACEGSSLFTRRVR